MSGMPKYPFRKRKTQCSLLPGISDLTHQEKLDGERRRRQLQRILSPLSSLTSCSSKMASICCARLQIWIAKSIVLIPLCRGPERGCKYCYATREISKEREGEYFTQPRTNHVMLSHSVCGSPLPLVRVDCPTDDRLVMRRGCHARTPHPARLFLSLALLHHRPTPPLAYKACTIL